MSNMDAFDTLPVRTISSGIQTGRWRAEDVARHFLARIVAREADVRAWCNFDPEPVLAQARTIDMNGGSGPLLGIPVAVKDVFATADFPTAYGSPIYKGNREASDAACVALARHNGALIMGKTVTTEFATIHPGETRNPLDLSRTPGGSSSGSVAAVADGMAMLAFGTQTAGSTIRPASYCGLAGYKPSFGLTPRAGLKLVSESFDTIGFIGRRVDDTALFAEAASGLPVSGISTQRPDPPRMAICRTREWAAAEPSTLELISAACDQLRALGVGISELSLPADFDTLADAHWDILTFEACRALAFERYTFPELCSTTLHKLFETGSAVSVSRYRSAQATAGKCRALFDQLMRESGVDAVISPAAPGEAPIGIDNTGDPIINRPWTALHVPCITLPLLSGPSGLPIGVQFVGRFGEDAALLHVAEWVEAKWPAAA
jgi:Asp-tRNA(Asn)/Glu-tRNA(Gln) amidotransferase A subunit family amidase